MRVLALFLSAGLVAAAATVYVYFQRNNDLTVQLAAKNEEIDKVKEELRQQRLKDESAGLQEANEVARLRSELQQQRSLMNDALLQLNALKNPQANTIPELESNLKREQETLADLKNQLKNYSSQHGQINQAKKQFDGAAAAKKRELESQLSAQVKEQQAKLKEVENSLSRQKKTKNDPYGLEKVRDLTQQVAEQKAFIEKLKAQKSAIDEEINSEKRYDDYKTQQGHREVSNEEDILRDKINAQNGVVTRLQSQVAAARQSLGTRQQNIRVAQARYDSLKTQVDELEKQLKAHEEHLGQTERKE